MLRTKLKNLKYYLSALTVIALILIGFNIVNFYKFSLEENYINEKDLDYKTDLSAIEGQQAYIIYKIGNFIKAKKLFDDESKNIIYEDIYEFTKFLSSNFNINNDFKIDFGTNIFKENGLNSKIIKLNARSNNDTNLVSFFSSFMVNFPAVIVVNNLKLERISTNPVIIEGNLEIEYYNIAK